MTKIHTNPSHMRKSGNKLTDFGSKIAAGGQQMETAGQNLVSHASGDKSGFGAVISNAMGKGMEVTGKVFGEGGRVAEEAGNRLGKTADLHEGADQHGAGLMNKLHPDAKYAGPSGGGSRTSSGKPAAGAKDKAVEHLPTSKGAATSPAKAPTAGGKDRTADHLPVSKGADTTHLSGDLRGHGSSAGTGAQTKVRYSDDSGIQHYKDGKLVSLREMKHPDADLVDNAKIRAAQLDDRRAGVVDRPGLSASDSRVTELTKSYEDSKWRPFSGAHAEEDWRKQFVKEESAVPGQAPKYNWPDSDKHPEGFDTAADRKPAVIEKGSVIDRFGDANGRFLSPPGTPYEQRGLPPSNLNDGYHQYRVVEDIPVWAGKIAPAMGQPGGGMQYLSPHSVADLILAGHLEEVT